MKGLIITNGYYSSPSSVHQAERMKEELLAVGEDVKIYKNDRLWDDGAFSEIDYAVYFDKDLYLARRLESKGIRLFNCAEAMENTDDKLKTYVVLKKHGLPTPDTYPSPKRYDLESDENYLRAVGERLGYPLVVKDAESSLGMGVYLAGSLNELFEVDFKLKGKPRLYQRYEKNSAGKSIRVIVIGGKAVCAMALKNDVDFRSNAAVGGVATAFKIDKKTAETAEKAARCLKLDYCGVDLFCDGENIIEINSNAYFRTMENTVGVNVAKRYANYIAENLRK